MAWCVERFDVDGADLEGTVVAGGFGDLVAVTAANYWEAECLDLGGRLADELSPACFFLNSLYPRCLLHDRHGYPIRQQSRIV